MKTITYIVSIFLLLANFAPAADSIKYTTTTVVVPRIDSPEDLKRFVQTIEVPWLAWQSIPASVVQFQSDGSCQNNIALWVGIKYRASDTKNIVISMGQRKASMKFNATYSEVEIVDFDKQRTFKSIVRPKS